MTSIYHTIKIKKIIFFGISTPISWTNTFKIREFRPNIENFHHHSNFFLMFLLRNKMMTSLHHSIEIENFIFCLEFLYLLRGLTPLKFENFDKKLKTST